MSTLDHQQINRLPNHLDLPFEDGRIKDFYEFPQAALLTECIKPLLKQLYPNHQYTIGHDSGIYWRYDPDNPLNGCVAPGWFFIPNVMPIMLNDTIRRSYVLWQEYIAPHIIIEFAQGDGQAELDRTPFKGKFWIYETIIRPTYYGILNFEAHQFELFRFDGASFHPVQIDIHGNLPLETLGVSLGIAQRTVLNVSSQWLCWFDQNGDQLLTSWEQYEYYRAKADKHRAKADKHRASAEKSRAKADATIQQTEQLRAKLLTLGVDPDSI